MLALLHDSFILIFLKKYAISPSVSLIYTTRLFLSLKYSINSLVLLRPVNLNHIITRNFTSIWHYSCLKFENYLITKQTEYGIDLLPFSRIRGQVFNSLLNLLSTPLRSGDGTSNMSLISKFLMSSSSRGHISFRSYTYEFKKLDI